MNVRHSIRWLAAAAALATASYATYAAVTWVRYGHKKRPADPDNSLLNRFLRRYEVVERHEVRVSAPAEITFSAACDMDLMDSSITRGIFKVRQLILGGTLNDNTGPRGLLAQTKALGWGVLGEVPGREIVMGAVTQPWQANVIFTGMPPEEFIAFNNPGFVKIAWTLRVDPIGPGESVFRTETRAMTTDPSARAKFRWYWSKASPGIWLIRRLSLGPLKREAERRVRRAAGEGTIVTNAFVPGSESSR
jgi:hypothetical protein